MEAVYAVVFLDAIHYHVRSEGQIVKKAVYIAIGVDLEGKKGGRIGASSTRKWPYSLRQTSYNRITTEHGKTLRLNRSIQVEGTFGVLKQDYGFRRFLRRGNSNVFTEVLLYAMAYNLNKLHNKMIRNLRGCTIYQLNSA